MVRENVICKYNRICLRESICILDPDHIKMDAETFKKYIMDNIDASPGKRYYYAKYWQAVETCRKKCIRKKYLDVEGLNDKTKLTAWIPDAQSEKIDKELIPDSSFGPKCRCYMYKDADPDIDPHMILIKKEATA